MSTKARKNYTFISARSAGGAPAVRRNEGLYPFLPYETFLLSPPAPVPLVFPAPARGIVGVRSS